MERHGEGEHVPHPLLALAGQVHQAPEGPVDVGFPRRRDPGDDLAPVRGELRHLVEHVFAAEPVARALQQARAGLVHVLPVAPGVQHFEHHVVAHRHVDARVEEVARIHHHRLARALGPERTQRRHQIVDRAVALEQVHVLGAAEAPLQGGRQDDDGHLRAGLPQLLRDFGTELARAQVVVQHRHVDRVQKGQRFFDGGGRFGLVAVLVQDGRAQQEVVDLVVEEQHLNRRLLPVRDGEDVEQFGVGRVGPIGHSEGRCAAALLSL